MQKRDRRGPQEDLLSVLDDLRQGGADACVIHLQRVMRGLKSRGHFFLEGAFVISALLEADRERLERPVDERQRSLHRV